MKQKIIIVVVMFGLLLSVLVYNKSNTVHQEKQLSSEDSNQEKQLSSEDSNQEEQLSSEDSNQEEQLSSEDNNQEEQLVPVRYDNTKVVEKQMLHLNDLENSSMLYEPVMKNYISQADAIVAGKVKEITYYEYKGMPWSKLTVNVNETIHGKIKAGEDISVYVMEGYQYSTPQKNKLIEISGDDIGLHSIGECIFLILTEEDGSSVFEKGSYRRTCSCFSEYRYNKKKKKFHVYEGETEKYWQKKTIREKIKKSMH